ncbi:MAG: hypothetical protein ACM3NQ_20395 [Bacteroidales bacterium]
MKTMVVLFNVVFVAFTCLVMLTDGFATERVYVVFSLLLIAVPVFTVAAVGRSVGNVTRHAAELANIILVAFIAWAWIDQYPHPSEAGFLPYVILAVITPLLSAAFLLFGGRRSTKQPARPAAV